MRVTPLSDEEAAALTADLWPAGGYDFEVRAATEETSKSNNDMIKLEVWIYNHSGGRRLCFDYLVSSEKAAWKVHQFAASCGLTEQYKSGDLMPAEIVGRTGFCEVAVQKATDDYPAKNIIRSYVKAKDMPQPTRATAPAREKAPVGDIDDEIPF